MANQDETGTTLRAFQVAPDGSGGATLTVAGATADVLGWASGSPVITSDGSASGSAILWVVDRLSNTSPSAATAELRAYNPVPVNGILPLLFKAPIGVGAKFSEPAADGNQVYVGTQDGHLLDFSPAPPVSNCTTYTSPGTGSHQVCGAIRAKYLALGGPYSFLGYPTTDEMRAPDGIGRYNHFSLTANNTRVDGSIYWTPGTGAWSIHGAIVTKREAMGAERSCLGYPLSDEFSITGGRRNNLQHGIISWPTGGLELLGVVAAPRTRSGRPDAYSECHHEVPSGHPRRRRTHPGHLQP
jgi:hypothetical protein